MHLHTALLRRTDGQTYRRLGLQLQAFLSLAVGGGEYLLHNPAHCKFFFATVGWEAAALAPRDRPYAVVERILPVIETSLFGTAGHTLDPVLTETVPECITLCSGHCVTGQSFV